MFFYWVIRIMERILFTIISVMMTRTSQSKHEMLIQLIHLFLIQELAKKQPMKTKKLLQYLNNSNGTP
jgi:hypothetical protein